MNMKTLENPGAVMELLQGSFYGVGGSVCYSSARDQCFPKISIEILINSLFFCEHEVKTLHNDYTVSLSMWRTTWNDTRIPIPSQ